MPKTGRTYLKIIFNFKKGLIERITKNVFKKHSDDGGTKICIGTSSQNPK